MPKASQDYNLYLLKPNLMMEWHPSRNAHLRPRDVTPGSAKKVWWLCEQGHEWQAAIYSRSRGSGCPYCYRGNSNNNDLPMVSSATLVREWHPTKNGNLRFKDVAPGFFDQVWWLCQKGHEWQATVKSRAEGAACPLCNGVSGQKRSSVNKTRITSGNAIAENKNRLSNNGTIMGPAISDMKSGTDFRKDTRFMFQDTVMLENQSSGQFSYARSVNISIVGMFFESEIPFRAGTRIIVQFNHPPFESTQKIYPSVVRWCKERAYDSTVSSYGVGVKFI
ncbi:MAG: PilZ domain-containing protein [Desulfobacterales bacterium]|nr:MAG: PilZ domain-containing protein [Desulfobacterales bacterium]